MEGGGEGSRTTKKNLIKRSEHKINAFELFYMQYSNEYLNLILTSGK